MSEELLNLKVEGIDQRLKSLEDYHRHCQAPEEGTLAKMKRSIDDKIDKVDSKVNWLVIFILTTVMGVLSTIVLRKLGVQ
jgi:hypothetical protein